MKPKSFLTAIFITISTVVFAQTPKLDQLDASGKKTGKWIVNLDKDWKEDSSSADAAFQRYTYFEKGMNIYPTGTSGGKNYTLQKPTEHNTENNVLDGEYKWFDANGKLSSVHVFKNGEYVSCKEYFPTGELSQHFDYTKKCEGQEHGWVVYIYDKKGNITQTLPTCKDNEGNWPRMR